MVAVSELRSANEAAAALGITKQTLSRWVDQGVIVPLRRDPLIFHTDDLLALQRPTT